MDKEQIKAIEARLAAATPGLWYSNQTEPAPYEVRSGAPATPDMVLAVVPEYGLNADFIAHAPADIRALLDALAAMQERAERAEKALRDLNALIDFEQPMDPRDGMVFEDTTGINAAMAAAYEVIKESVR